VAFMTMVMIKVTKYCHSAVSPISSDSIPFKCTCFDQIVNNSKKGGELYITNTTEIRGVDTIGKYRESITKLAFTQLANNNNNNSNSIINDFQEATVLSNDDQIILSTTKGTKA
jgi:hypothetical protein